MALNSSSDLVSREPFRVLAFLRNAFGPPTTDRVTLIEIPGDSVNNFAVDGLVAISRGSYRRIEQSGTYLSAMLAHELAHLWWGDLVNPVGPGARWLTEGFAEYSRYLYERATGGESLAWSYRNLVMVRQFAGREPPPLAGNPAEGEDEAIYYQKGAFVLRMLAGEIGDDALVAAMRRLAERRRGQTATLDDFVAAVGVDRLNWFFDQWPRRPTGPRLRLSVSTAEARGDSVVVRGMIEQAMPAYRLSLPLVAYSTRDTSMQSIQVAGPRTAFTLRLTRRPGWRLVVDPDGTVFQWFTRE